MPTHTHARTHAHTHTRTYLIHTHIHTYICNCVGSSIRLSELKEKADNNLSGLELSNKQLIQLQLLEDDQHWINDHMLLASSEQFPTCLTEASTMINQHKVNHLYITDLLLCTNLFYC